jgi:hypothetical protein
MNTKFFGGVALAALGALWLTPAAAAPVIASGVVDGGYSYSSVNNHGGNANDWSINGSGVLPIATNWAVQGDVGYSSISASGASENNTYGIASGFYAGSFGRIGASVGYTQLAPKNATVDATSYGVFGDWYGGDQFTVSARGGGISGTGHANGGSATISGADYVGGQVVGYIMPNLAATGTVDYVRVPLSGTSVTATSYRVGGEYLLSQSMPLAVSADYSYATVNVLGFSGSDNTFSIGLKYYFGGNGSLEDHQRSGSEGWGAASPVQGLRF